MTFQGVSIADVNWGLITKLEARVPGGPTFLNMGKFDTAHINMAVLSKPGDPSGTMYAFAVKYTLRVDLIQSGAAEEIALFGASGILTTDAEVRITFAGGRTITLGSVAGYPLRLIPSFDGGDEAKAQIITVEAQNIEPLTSFPAKVA